MYLPKKHETSLAYEDAVTRNFGFDPSIDTFWQRADKLDAVLDHARTITDEDVPWLQRIVDDGSQAYNEFLLSNMKLAYAAAIYAGYADDREESSEILDYAISGLQRAIWGYNPNMSFTFSNYAVPVVRARIFKLSATRYKERFGVSLQRAEEIMMTRVAHAQLRKQASANADEQRREPSLEELARAVLQPLLRARLVNRLKTEPTATQLQAGWREYMPEFLRRIEENIDFVNTYDRITRAASLDRHLRDGDDRTLYDTVASRQQVAFAFPGEQPDNLTLAADVKAALDRAGMSEREQFTLGHHFGISDYTCLPNEEIAAREGINEDAVPVIIASAVEKIRRSPEAQALLMPYLRR